MSGKPGVNRINPDRNLTAAEKCARYRAAFAFGSSASRSRVHPDHCHRTGEFRGVLCQGCNTEIGVVGDDDPIILMRAAEYVRNGGAI